MPPSEPISMPPRTTTPASADAHRINDIDYLTREEALALLGIKKESLYTYASRGLIRTIPGPGKRTRLYLKVDIEKLRTRAGVASEGARVAPVFRYGEPVIQTWICEITETGPRYRGVPATTLASEGRSLEYVAELLWGGLPPPVDQPWPAPPTEGPAPALSQGPLPDPLHALAEMTLRHAGGQGLDQTLHLDARSCGIRLITQFAGLAGRLGPQHSWQPPVPREFIANRLLRGFGLSERPDADQILHLLNAALVLSADNELTAPTFAARLIASTGANLYSCVAAALAAQAGPMQAGGAAHLEAYLREHLRQPRPWVGTGPGIPCFDHPLYDKDPRAEAILALLERLEEAGPERTDLLHFVERTYADSGRYPNIFAALVILAMSLRLSPGSAAFLHSLARTAGWVSHAAEQRLSGTMLRPRARYMGSGT